MTTQEFISLITQTIIVPLLIWGLTILRNYLLTKAKSKQIEDGIYLADKAIKVAVGEAGQIFVDEIKSKEGKLTKEQAEEAFRLAYNRSVEILGDSGVELLKVATSNAAAYITAKIEEEVRNTRTNSESEDVADCIGFTTTPKNANARQISMYAQGGYVDPGDLFY